MNNMYSKHKIHSPNEKVHSLFSFVFKFIHGLKITLIPKLVTVEYRIKDRELNSIFGLLYC